MLIELYLTFLKIGAFAFGGGYAVLSLIEREIVTNKGWITLREFTDVIGISQMTPGPIAINAATFVGYKVGGPIGSFFATLGVVTVSFILISIASHYMAKFKESKVMKACLMGMRPALIGLIISAFLSLGKESYKDFKSVLVGIGVMGLLLSKKINPILVIVMAGAVGVIIF